MTDERKKTILLGGREEGCLALIIVALLDFCVCGASSGISIQLDVMIESPGVCLRIYTVVQLWLYYDISRAITNAF